MGKDLLKGDLDARCHDGGCHTFVAASPRTRHKPGCLVPRRLSGRWKELNRNIQQEQRVMERQQQYQIDNNQLRQRLDRQQNFANPSPPARIGTCPAGSIGC